MIGHGFAAIYYNNFFVFWEPLNEQQLKIENKFIYKIIRKTLQIGYFHSTKYC